VYCSSSDEKKNAKYPDASSFCMGWAQAECADAVLTACLSSSKDLCITQRQSACMTRVVTPAQEANLSYDSSRAEACVSAVSSAYADAKLTSDEENTMREACEPVFSGFGSKGSACNANSDCKQSEGLRCVVHLSSSNDAGPITGTCQQPVAASPGASCSAPEAQCAEGFHCGTSAHCDQDAELGQNCSLQNPCAEGLECSSSDSGEPTCLQKAGIGDACNFDLDCASGYCVENVHLCAEAYQLSQNEPFCRPLHD
jgi:hypothetical protein